MMQTRDFYSQDYIFKYVKLASLGEFQEQMFNPQRHQKQVLLLQDQDQQEQVDSFNFFAGLSLFTISSSILSVALYKKIPLLNRVEKRYKRVILKVLMFITPIQIVSAYAQLSQLQLTQYQFEKYQRPFQQYLFSGDIRALKPDIKFSQV